MPILVAFLFALLIVLAPVLSGHPADLSDQTTAIAVLDADDATTGPDGVHPDPAGLSCHPVGGCSVAVMLPEAAQTSGGGLTQMHRRLRSLTWTTRQVAPDTKPPIA
jgi:hypothetical protein